MSDERNQQNSALLVVGGLLIVVGGWLMAKQFGLVPEPLLAGWRMLSAARGAVALVLIGVAVIFLANRGAKVSMPEKGARLYRSRDDKWVSGVLGGIAAYFGIDSVLLRVGFLAIAFVVNFWTAAVAYLVLSMVMPEAPKEPAPPTQAG